MGNLEDETVFLPGVLRRELDGAEPLIGTDGKTVLDYWRWAQSDVLENVQRGIFAEFLVAAALGVTHAARYAKPSLQKLQRSMDCHNRATPAMPGLQGTLMRWSRRR